MSSAEWRLLNLGLNELMRIPLLVRQWLDIEMSVTPAVIKTRLLLGKKLPVVQIDFKSWENPVDWN